MVLFFPNKLLVYQWYAAQSASAVLASKAWSMLNATHGPSTALMWSWSSPEFLNCVSCPCSHSVGQNSCKVWPTVALLSNVCRISSQAIVVILWISCWTHSCGIFMVTVWKNESLVIPPKKEKTKHTKIVWIYERFCPCGGAYIHGRPHCHDVSIIKPYSHNTSKPIWLYRNTSVHTVTN